VLANSTLLEEALDEWRRSRTGPLTNSVDNNVIWGRLPPNSPFDDPSSGPNSPHWELLPSVNFGTSPTPHVIMFISMVSPASRMYFRMHL
jgi:hypothetical protein